MLPNEIIKTARRKVGFLRGSSKTFLERGNSNCLTFIKVRTHNFIIKKLFNKTEEKIVSSSVRCLIRNVLRGKTKCDQVITKGNVCY